MSDQSCRCFYKHFVVLAIFASNIISAAVDALVHHIVALPGTLTTIPSSYSQPLYLRISRPASSHHMWTEWCLVMGNRIFAQTASKPARTNSVAIFELEDSHQSQINGLI